MLLRLLQVLNAAHFDYRDSKKKKIDFMSDIGLFEHILGDVKLEKKPQTNQDSTDLLRYVSPTALCFS